MEKKRIKILFLISEESENYEISLKKLEELIQDGKDLTVISMSILTSMELKKRKIDYKTPDFYFKPANSDKLDDSALKFAKEWYKPFENEITYKGISLGEMLIYDFYSLFVDSIRSIEIASTIIENESPNEIYLPHNLKINEPNFVCYETLPKTIQCLTKNRIKINIIKDVKDNFHAYQYVSYLKVFLWENIFKLINFYQKNILSKLINKKDSIQFLGVYSYDSLHLKLKERGINSYKVYPIKFKNKLTVKFIQKNQVLFEKLKNNKYSKLKLEYKNINLYDLLDHRFEEAFTTKFTQLIGYIEWTEYVIENLSPNLLVAMEDITPIKRTICKSYKNHNIPSIIIQHGMVTKSMAGFGVMPLEAKVQAVWGLYSYNWHLERGNKKQIITGNPSYDQIVPYEFNKEDICNHLNLNPNKKIILITPGRFANIETKYTIEGEARLIRDLLKSLKYLTDEQIVVKLHPAYQEKYATIVSEIADEENIQILIVKDNIWDLISICDILITFTSTTWLEAMLFDKPVLIVDTEYKEGMLDYNFGDAVINVYDKKEIVPFVKKLLYIEKCDVNLSNIKEKIIYENAYLMDGKASDRITELIIKLMKN